MTLTEHFSVAGVFRDKIQHTFRFHYLSGKKITNRKISFASYVGENNNDTKELEATCTMFQMRP